MTRNQIPNSRPTWEKWKESDSDMDKVNSVRWKVVRACPVRDLCLQEYLQRQKDHWQGSEAARSKTVTFKIAGLSPRSRG